MMGADELQTARLLLRGLDAESRRRRWFTGAVDIRKAEDWAAHPERSCAVGLLALADGEPADMPCSSRSWTGRGEVAAAWRRHGAS